MVNIMISNVEENLLLLFEEGKEPSLKEVGAWLLNMGQNPVDIYHVKSEELQFYLYSPLPIRGSDKVDLIKERAKQWMEKASETELERLDRICGIYKSNNIKN